MLVEASAIINCFFNSVSYQLYSTDADRHLEIKSCWRSLLPRELPKRVITMAKISCFNSVVYARNMG